jgi:DNA-binding Lrp family transcriptional regulator
VRGRIKRLVADRVIQVQAVCDTVAFGIGAHAFVGIKTRDGLTDEVGRQLVVCENVAELTRTLGEYDFIAVVIASTRDLLFEALLNEITVIPGIRWTETFETCAAAKHAYAWSWLV